MSGYYTKCRECGQFVRQNHDLCAVCARSGMGLIVLTIVSVVTWFAVGYLWF